MAIQNVDSPGIAVVLKDIELQYINIDVFPFSSFKFPFRSVLWLLANHWSDRKVINEGARERSQGAEGAFSSIGRNNNTNQLVPPELPGTKPPTKEYTWRDPWLQLHM